MTQLQGWQRALSFPDAENTGANLDGVTLVNVPGSVTSGPGWSWGSGQVTVSGEGTIFSGYNVAGGILVQNSNVTVENCVFAGAGATHSFPNITFNNCIFSVPGAAANGILFEGTATYGSVINCTISGTDNTTNRVGSAVTAASGDPGFVLTGSNIYWCRQGVNTPAGGFCVITGNYFHDMGFLTGDHTEPIAVNEQSQCIIANNTIINQLNQTAAVILTGGSNSLNVITSNLIGGGSYAFYAGSPIPHGSNAGPCFNLVFSNNYFTTLYYADSGLDGTTSDWQTEGNIWDNNWWYDGLTGGSSVAEPSDSFVIETPPAVPASGTALTNPFGVDVVVNITASNLTGSTPTAVKYSSTYYQIQLISGQNITLDYTGTVTWQWIIA
jgi:hypothetical protein